MQPKVPYSDPQVTYIDSTHLLPLTDTYLNQLNPVDNETSGGGGRGGCGGWGNQV